MIVHDKRYGALRTLGERKQAFNEVYILLVLRNDVQMHLNIPVCKVLLSLFVMQSTSQFSLVDLHFQ